MFIKISRAGQFALQKCNNVEIHGPINILLRLCKFIKIDLLLGAKYFLNLFRNLFLNEDSCVEVFIAPAFWGQHAFLCPCFVVVHVGHRHVAQNYSWILRSYVPVSIEVKDVKHEFHLSFNARVVDLEHHVDKFSEIDVAVFIYV